MWVVPNMTHTMFLKNSMNLLDPFIIYRLCTSKLVVQGTNMLSVRCSKRSQYFTARLAYGKSSLISQAHHNMRYYLLVVTYLKLIYKIE